LTYVAKNEGIEAEQEALHIIAQKADGALRDALSIFDQIISFCGDKLTYQAVIQNLNILDYDYYFKVTDALYNADIPSALNGFNEILNNGFDGHHFINGLGMHFRNLLVAKDPTTLSLLEVGDSIKQRYLEQSNTWEQHHLLKALELCNKVDLNYRMSKNQRLLVEITLMQICGVKEISQTTEKKTFVVKKQTENQLKETPKPLLSDNSTPTFNKTQEKVVEKVIEKPEIDLPKESKKSIKIVNFKDNLENKTISINIGSEEKKQEEETSQTTHLENLNTKDFTQENLNSFWQKFASEKQNDGKHNLLSILRDKKAILGDDYNICMSLDNKVQEEVLNEERSNILGYLKSKLENDKITLKIDIKPIKEEEIKAYTPEDKFKKMAKKNPHLLTLKEGFDLEINL
jgi:DNA polymerase-3 subunit gamma/tau